MSARDRILGRVRAALGREAAIAPDAAAALDAYVREHPAGPRPRIDGSLIERFKARAATLSSTVEHVETLASVPRAVRRYLDSIGVAPNAVAWPELAALDWDEAGVAVEARKADAADQVGITGSFCALAETGSLLTLSRQDRPAATSLLPPTHIAIVSAERIVATMEDAWSLLRNEQGTLPRATNFISGPSRTADIEQTLVLGAHGPCRVHVIVHG